MSRFVDLLQRISDGSPAPIGFGAARAAATPGLALVGMVSGGNPGACSDAASAGVDAVLVSGASADGAQSLADSCGGVPWGLIGDTLSGELVQAARDGGADIMAFGLATAAATIAGEDDLGRFVSVDPTWSDRELRAVASLPVDGLVLDMTTVSGPWSLQDLVTVGSITRRTDKHVLVRVEGAPSREDLEAIRDMGAAGLVLSLDGTAAEEISALKADLLSMPRPRRRRDRMRATVPGAGFPAPSPTPREDDDGDDDDYDDYE